MAWIAVHYFQDSEQFASLGDKIIVRHGVCGCFLFFKKYYFNADEFIAVWNVPAPFFVRVK